MVLQEAHTLCHMCRGKRTTMSRVSDEDNYGDISSSVGCDLVNVPSREEASSFTHVL